MKGFVLALLAVGVLGGPVSLAQFMSGYSQGLEQPETCLENPEMCGEFLGEVAGILGSTLRDYEVEQKLGAASQDVQLFLNGLVTGLRLTNATTSACVNDFTQGGYQISTIYNAIMSLLQSNTDYGAIVEFLCSGVSIVNFTFLKDCNFPLLWSDIRALTLDILISRYLDKSCDINTAIVAIINCDQDNLPWCGYNVGVLIRDVTTWGV